LKNEENEQLLVAVDGHQVRAEIVNVGPELAARWLEHNAGNRTISSKHVATLVRAMESGLFRFVADPVRFDGKGRLLDGQHRLTAVIRSKTTQPMLVVAGLESDAQLFMDANRKRSSGDQVKLTLGVGDSSAYAAITRLLIRWDVEDLNTRVLTPSPPEVVAFIEENRAEVDRAVSMAGRVYSGVGGGSKAVAGATFFMAERKDPVGAHVFWSALASGENLRKGQPEYILRDALIRRRTAQRWTPAEEIAAYVRCWNAHRRGANMTRLQISRGELTDSSFVMK
jgi:hypothetical protein